MVIDRTKIKQICKDKGLYKPFKSWKSEKKLAVYVKSNSGNTKVVHFGAKGYEDYTQHKDPERRRLFRARMQCDPVSNLNKNTARYWACQKLW